MDADVDDDDVRLRTDAAAAFLSAALGIHIQPKTLSNWRAKRSGPPVKYFGLTPVYKKSDLRDWAKDRALKDEPSRRVRARDNRAADVASTARETGTSAAPRTDAVDPSRTPRTSVRVTPAPAYRPRGS
jgi:hypothetical protein